MQYKNVPEGTILLQKWLEERKMSIKDFARYLDLHYHVCWYWVTGNRCPELTKAVLIENATSIPCRSWTTTVQIQTFEKSQKKGRPKTDAYNKKKGDESS